MVFCLVLFNLPDFSLRAATCCEAKQRGKVEELCRYITRPAIANERPSTNEQGQVVYRFKQPFRDGTTHLVLDPLDFMARLAALVARPRLNLTRTHSVFASNCKLLEHITRRKARLFLLCALPGGRAAGRNDWARSLALHRLQD